MKVSLYLFVFLMATSLFSCKKSDDNKDCTLSEANLVGTYKIGEAKYKASASSPEVDAIATGIIDACTLDDLINFKSDHTVVYTDAGVKCDESGDDTGKWSLKGNTITIDGEDTPFASFDCSGFTITESGYETDDDSMSITYKKQ